MKRTIAIAALALCASAAFAQFSDTFDSIDPAWVTDRYEPNGFQSAFFDGDNRLKITIDPADAYNNRPSGYNTSTFYNTQGRQRPGGNIGPDWTVSGDVYISSDMLTSGFNWRTDLWTRDNNANENNAFYGIFGAKRFDDSDPFNEGATNKSNVWRIWDADTANGWVTLADAVTTGWHNLAITSHGSTADYYLDGNLVYTDADASLASPELRTVFVQAYNFSDATHTPASAYSVYWDNINAVPEPASMLVIAGLAAVAARKKRKS
ncbi:MAG: hypothetical protein JNM28_04875 [Armatimonadetes bacterium]|nr:hypothetical protein [Armatimonadota bacterium]MBS1712490.1 hypothetical protein [Armatimonadota bacterium]MBX3109201.1 hypothetical protein [Fimbriimonadaceae bacterium]